jgi:hypothetical protein
MAQRHVKQFITNAIGHCDSCGDSLKGDGIEAGPLAGDTICLDCAGEITRMVLAREGKVTIHHTFKVDPIKYLSDHGLIDKQGRVRKELLEQLN